MYEIELSRKAARFYQKADTATVRRLNAAFDRLAEDPLHHYNIKPLAGELQGSYRLRVGDIRIVYSVDDAVKIVFIEVIGFRGDVYKKIVEAVEENCFNRLDFVECVDATPMGLLSALSSGYFSSKITSSNFSTFILTALP